MGFNEFIKNLNEDDRNNYDTYSIVRGKQQYKIIYNALSKYDEIIAYKDVNSFVRYDKAIKDVLYKYLGALEESIKVHIFSHYDFKNDISLKKDKYIFFNQIQGLIEPKKVSMDEISELYKRYELNFKDMVDLLVEFEPVGVFDTNKLYEIKELRNDVMHHTPLLFSVESESLLMQTTKRITYLIDMLPKFYKQFIAEDINDKTNHTKKNIKEKFYSLLLKEF